MQDTLSIKSRHERCSMKCSKPRCALQSGFVKRFQSAVADLASSHGKVMDADPQTFMLPKASVVLATLTRRRKVDRSNANICQKMLGALCNMPNFRERLNRIYNRGCGRSACMRICPGAVLAARN